MLGRAVVNWFAAEIKFMPPKYIINSLKIKRRADKIFRISKPL